MFVAIDFPDFNFRLASAVRRLGVPVVYYISPQLWAWRPGRIHAMKRFVTKVLPIFPFEAALYEREGIPVTFVGHPLVDLFEVRATRDAFLSRAGLDESFPNILAWLAKIHARPAYRRALEVGGSYAYA